MLVIFDCDGVLVNSEAIYIQAELDHLAAAGLNFDRRDYMTAFTGMPMDAWERKLTELAMTRFQVELASDFFDRLARQVKDQIERDLAMVPGARDHIEALERPVCVASSTGLEKLHWKLNHTGLAPLFGEGIYSADMVTHGKPEPDLFLHAAREMGAKPKDCIVVEDSSNGVLAGKAAGMTVIGFTGGAHCLDAHDADLIKAGADHVAADYPALQEMLGYL
ncbi:HAD family hydrolase [Aestuariispira insulae]|uniref:HAD superfamily hydrolase (TIGR01509 family) n=1 Tax=Aestuariispira insulae TaxID=1461337 RepID=A0A3D9HRI1_9PROT|nr:HAD family hydrolase [Aestuariispira insulae]RED52098.1 HAD superfamily hydrolase (TIGR01509 family) [Aestuariispira insulae]